MMQYPQLPSPPPPSAEHPGHLSAPRKAYQTDIPAKFQRHGSVPIPYSLHFDDPNDLS